MTRSTSKMVARMAIWLITAGSFDARASDVLKGGTFTMPCFDANIPTSSAVMVRFIPEFGIERQIANYSVETDEFRSYDAEYHGRISLGSDSILVISDIRIADEGLYKCITGGFDIDVPIEKSELLNVLVRPVIDVTTFPVYASGEDKEAAYCKASGARPEAFVTWSSDRYLLHDQTQTTNPGTLASTTDSTSTLTIVSTKFYNNQPFICTVRHQSFSGGANSTLVTLDVRYSPTVPVIDVINQTQLKCRADGNPSPTITWTMPDGITPPNPVVGTSVVQIISPNDAARQNDTYICHASSGIDPATSSNITTAQAVPFIEVSSQPNTGIVIGAVIGAVIGCVAILAITATVCWFFIRNMREKSTGPYPHNRTVRANDEHRRDSQSTSPHGPSQNKSQPQSSPQAAPQSDSLHELPFNHGEHAGEQENLMPNDEEVNGHVYKRVEGEYQTPLRYDEPPTDNSPPPYSNIV